MKTRNIDGGSIIDPRKWTVVQVKQWLIEKNLADCVEILCNQQKINGEILMQFEENEILHLTNKPQLWLAIKQLKEHDSIQISTDFNHNHGTSLVIPMASPLEHRSSSSSTLHSQCSETTVFIEPNEQEEIEDQPITRCCSMLIIRSDRKKTFFAFLLAFSTVYFCSFIVTIVDERLPNPKYFPPLPDLILDNIQQIPWAFAVTEKLIITEISILVLVLAFHRYRLVDDWIGKFELFSR